MQQGDPVQGGPSQDNYPMVAPQQEITVNGTSEGSTATTVQSPLIAQEIFLGEDDIYESDTLEALKSGKPTPQEALDLLKRSPKYTPETQVPSPLPINPPRGPWWFLLMKSIGNSIDWWNNFTPRSLPGYPRHSSGFVYWPQGLRLTLKGNSRG